MLERHVKRIQFLLKKKSTDLGSLSRIFFHHSSQIIWTKQDFLEKNTFPVWPKIAGQMDDLEHSPNVPGSHDSRKTTGNPTKDEA